MVYEEKLIKELEEKARAFRREVIRMVKQAGFGWVGGSFSEAEIIVALIFHHMKHDSKNPQWPDRDRLIVSKAHSCEMLYAALGEAGYFSKKEFLSYGKFGALLQAHTDRRTPGVEYSGGSLGLGFSFALGEALAARINAAKDQSVRRRVRYRVFCILGDGECNEGEVWQVAMAAAHHKVDNLTAIVDYNKFQSTGKGSEIISLQPLGLKWQAFGWDVTEINGHSFPAILSALERANNIPDKPQVIIANTLKGKGLPSFENTNILHVGKLPDEVYAEAMKVLK